MPHFILDPPQRSLLSDGSRLGGWWHSDQEADRIVCDLCPRECHLKPGDRGFCFVRENRAGEMVLTTYGRSTGFCIDPIEKKPLHHFYPGTSVLSFGTAGCNLGCKFCQNHDISKAREIELLSEIASPQAIAQAALSHGCQSVAYTYNDPVIWAEYAMDTAKACRAVGLKSVAVTAGYITPQARAAFFQYFDAANVDLKGFTESFYQQLTLSHLQPVLDTLCWLKKETNVWFEITNLIIPRANDSPDELRRMCDWIVSALGDDIPVHFTAFHPDFRMLDRPRTPHETLLAAQAIARQQGIRYAYVGNVDDVEHQSTYCPQCGQLLIERNWYELGRYELLGSRCGGCGAEIAGHFAAGPGTWGRRRQPVSIGRYQASPLSPGIRDPVSLPGPAGRSHTPRTTPEAKMEETCNTPLADATCGSFRTLSACQQAAVHAAASEIIAAKVQQRACQLTKESWGDAASVQVHGAYVTLKRQHRLRACCGFVGHATALCEAVTLAAHRTARDDYRLPPISPTELPYLELETWLLDRSEEITSTGPDRVQDVVIGRHGLHIARGEQRGLLLPGVAVDHGFDREEFLRQVCRKAGLPAAAWLDRDTRLHRFEGISFIAALQAEACNRGDSEVPQPISVDDLHSLQKWCGESIQHALRGSVPSFYLPGVGDAMVHAVGIVLDTEPLRAALRVSLRPAIPLQATLSQLAAELAKELERVGQGWPFPSPTPTVCFGFDPAMHGTASHADLRGWDPLRRALISVRQSRVQLRFDPGKSRQGILKELTEGEGETGEWELYSMAMQSTASPVQLDSRPRPVSHLPQRMAAVAGRFYPGDAEHLQALVDELLPQGRSAAPLTAVPAAMVPHAGLVYSGSVAAKVLARIQFPESIIILGPKHTADGIDYAVAPCDEWHFPGGMVPGEKQLAHHLTAGIPGWQLDAAAHAREHAIEVELPFLARLAPHGRIVGVALGHATLQQSLEFGDHLAQVLRQWNRPCLLLVSSDMNHFATDAENRRLDEIALSALETLDPKRAYSVIRQNEISMCGLVPAIVVMRALLRLNRLSRLERVAYATSAEVTGDTSRVVGYAGLLFHADDVKSAGAAR